jgi:hypothetical protein
MSNETKKQTAVEWLVNELEKHHIKIDIKNTVAFQQAKEMEKEQIIKAANILLYHGPGPGNTAAEQYYNKTYEK